MDILGRKFVSGLIVHQDLKTLRTEKNTFPLKT